ncbi:hypothetical protein HNQ56_002923 [Anaerotaenia torta]|uniref:S-layer homology domain-containing protein n=1 Tax=Anaerotaenia torta TaxID=433293 RepID=UPI003D1F60FB
MKVKKIPMAVILILLGLLFSSTVHAADRFTDVKPGAWYYNHVKSAVESGYMKGAEANKFKPNDPMTRAEFVQLLTRLTDGYDADQYKKSPIFKDVKKKSKYAPAINWE